MRILNQSALYREYIFDSWAQHNGYANDPQKLTDDLVKHGYAVQLENGNVRFLVNIYPGELNHMLSHQGKWLAPQMFEHIYRKKRLPMDAEEKLGWAVLAMMTAISLGGCYFMGSKIMKYMRSTETPTYRWIRLPNPAPHYPGRSTGIV